MSANSSESQRPTVGQLEREISQKIRALYRDQLGHQPSKVSCQLFGCKLACVLENTVTKPEQLLAENGNDDLAEKVREDLEQSLQPLLKQLVEGVLAVNVIDILSDSTIDTGRAGLIVILDEEPQYRPSKRH